MAGRVRPSLASLAPPDALPDIEVAVDAIVGAIRARRPLVLNADFDVDGVTAAAVTHTALAQHFGVPPQRVQVFFGVRRRDGYGLSSNVAERILAAVPPGALVITLDQGSSDGPRIRQLVDAGHDVVVTDHHLLDGQGPDAALAVVNPVREDSRFPDPRICGVHVAWLVMCAVRQRLVEIGHLPTKAPRLGALLDYVGLGSMADVTDLGRSANNRAVINAAIERMNAGARPCWQAFRRAARLHGAYDSSTLAFALGPAINARGRIGESTLALAFLLAPDMRTATERAVALLEANARRKAIQAEMLERATEWALRDVEAGYQAVTIHDPAGHNGVNGICAARLVELTGRPVAYFSPRQDRPDQLTGSLRTVPGFHVRDALAGIALRLGEGMPHFGGHEGAGGATVHASAIPAFREAFHREAEERLQPEELGPRILTDGLLPQPPTLAHVAEIAVLGPWGRAFEPPVFRARGTARALRAVGSDQSHLRFDLEDEQGGCHEAIWFGAIRGGVCPVQDGQRIELACELDANTFRDLTRLQLRVRAAVPAGG